LKVGRKSARNAGSPSWETLLAHAAALQTRVPGAVLVGGTAAAVHAKHRYSLDHDHVVANLARNYDATVSALESIVGWRTHRRVKGKLVLGRIGGIDVGVRNLRRAAPLDTISIPGPKGAALVIPTVAEMLRIKAFLVVDRNATRDYLDVAALSHHLGVAKSVAALATMNELYADFAGEGGDMLMSLVVGLSAPTPYDLGEVNLIEYKGIVAPWSSWNAVEKQCAKLAAGLV
jgi:hypothetical protein